MINGVAYIRPRGMTEYENVTNPISPSRSALETFYLAEVALQSFLSFTIFSRGRLKVRNFKSSCTPR